jgi:hypothetical protein
MNFTCRTAICTSSLMGYKDVLRHVPYLKYGPGKVGMSNEKIHGGVALYELVKYMPPAWIIICLKPTPN